MVFRSSLNMKEDIDTVGRIVENEVVSEINVSLWDADLENVQDKLQVQLLHRELAQRELEFLENGGDPLDFRFRHTSSVSVQSTSLVGQHQEQIVTRKATSEMSLFGTLAHSDEPTLRQRENVWDANTVDNIFPISGKYQPADAENSSIDPNINRNVASSEHSSQVERTQDGKESEESAFVRPYTRRNRSKPNHDVSTSALVDVIPSRGSVQGPVPSQFGLRDANDSLFDSNHIDQKNSSSSAQKSTRSSPDKNQMFIDISCFDSRSSNAENVAGLPKVGYDDGSLQALTSVVPQVHFVDETTEVILGKADLLSNGCLHSENANRNDEVNAVAVEIESQCVQGNSQVEAEKGLIKAVNECVSGQIVVGGDISDVQIKFENNAQVGTSEISTMANDFQAGARISTVFSGTESNNPVVSVIGSVHSISVSDPTIEVGRSATVESIGHEISQANSYSKSSVDAPEPENGCTKELQKVDEDAILAEALLIEAKQKRISQLVSRTIQLDKSPKSHWHFVLEEMAWLANDFLQERVWKISAAAKFGYQAALALSQRVEEKMPIIKSKAVAQSNTRAVLKFWQSVESFVYTEDRKPSVHDKTLLHFNTNDTLEDQTEESEIVQESKSEVKQHRHLKNHAIREYAIRFLKYNATVISDFNDVDTQLSPGLKCSLLTMEEGNVLKSKLTDESLFYKVPAGAMESYRNAVESHVLQCEVLDGRLHEDERPLYDDATAEHMYTGEEDEQDTCCLPSAFEGSHASNMACKKRKNLSNAYASGMYDVGADLNFGRHHSGFYGRPIPKKRSHIDSRERHPSDRIDASSEDDTDFFQDDQIEYSMNMEDHLDVESNLSKSTQTNYLKYQNLSQKQRWRHKTPHLDGQLGIIEKRTNKQLKCVGVDGTIEKPNAKRSKTLNKGTFPSDVASQIKKIARPSQILRMIGVRDHASKAKQLKGSSGKSGLGHMWSSFEDQALVVLVHDFGPNWNLISDAMNSALQFVYTFRKPDECMERHKFLMDKTTDDRADSADDYVSSQPYPSTLPGIPKGSARQLFQHLQGPMEEVTLRSHFEKIMFTRRKQHNRKIQNDVHGQKQVVPTHNSHATALSEVSQNYLNRGYPTPLNLCDLTLSDLDSVTFGLQDTHSVHPSSSANSSYQGASGLVTGSNSPHGMGPLNASFRDVTPLTNEQQKSIPMSTQQSTLPVSGFPSILNQNSVRTVPGALSVGMMGGLNSQSLLISRPGLQGTNLSSIPIAGGMSLAGMISMQNHVNPRVNSNQGTSASNFSDNPTTLSRESQKQMTATELHIHATQGNNQDTMPSREINSSFSGRSSAPMGQIHPVQNQPQHQMPPHQSQGLNHHPRIGGPSVLQHPAYARLVKEQQFQQQQSSAVIPTRPMSQSPLLPEFAPMAPIVLPSPPSTLVSQAQQNHQLPPQARQPSHPFQQSGRPHHHHPRPQLVRPQQLAKFTNGAVPASISTSQNGTGNSSHLSRISSAVGDLSTDQLASVHGGPAQFLHPQTPQSFGNSFQQNQLNSSVPSTNLIQHTPANSDNCSQNKILPRSSSDRSSNVKSTKSGGASGGNPSSNKKLKSLQKIRNDSSNKMKKERRQNHLGNTEQMSKDLTKHDQPGEQIKNSIPSSNTMSSLPRVTGSNGRASVNLPPSTLLRTESELYDSVLQNFDNEMRTASKQSKTPSAIRPDPTVTKGLPLQTQESSGMIPSQLKSSQQPDTHCAELIGTLPTQPTIK